jgi:hypothetical protein
VVASVDDVLMLRDYSFVTFAGDAHTFEMHRLVQLATRKWLETQKELDKWREREVQFWRSDVSEEWVGRGAATKDVRTT